jgi:hypothetical protein
MEPDAKQDFCVKELYVLTQLKRHLKSIIDPISHRMDELAREMATLKLGDARRAEVLAARGKTAHECESGLKYFAQAL